MLWVLNLNRLDEMFFWAPKTYILVKTYGLGKINIFTFEFIGLSWPMKKG